MPEENSSKPSIIPDQFRALFSEPPLLEGEDPNLFWGLVAAVIAERKPVTASDWIAVNDLVTKLWEERLLRRASDALVRGGMMQTLGSFLAEEEGEQKHEFDSPVEAEQYQQQSAAAARRWLEDCSKKNPKERRKIGTLLARFGMTEAELYAKAFEQKSDTLQIFERMIAARERGRRKLA